MIYNKVRIKRKEIEIGNVRIGGESPIAIQSMTNTDPHNFEATFLQAQELSKVGCDIIRVTIPDKEASDVIPYMKKRGLNIPIVADIHFDYKLALLCVDKGIDKIRINPGNIGCDSNVKEVCDVCKKHKVPIRIGVNSGSLEKHILNKYGSATAEALCESAMYHINLLERFDYDDITISIKSSNVKRMIDSNVMLSEMCKYPIHLGVTEAGAGNSAIIKSSAGIGSLLCRGIGDTIRISLTDDPISEIYAARELLTALDIEGQSGLNIISCPTCGRTSIDLIELCRRFKEIAIKEGIMNCNLTVALMGCAVNGPGEAREADIGIAAGRGEALLFCRGEAIRKIKEEDIIYTLIKEIKEIANNKL